MDYDRFKNEIDTFKERQTNIYLILHQTFDILKTTQDSISELTFEEWCQYMSFKFCMVLERFPKLEGFSFAHQEDE